MPIPTCGYAAQAADAQLKPWKFELRELQPNELLVDVDFCGICHSDIHMARNEWHDTEYPIVPGHEVVGTVKAVGSQVSKFKVGDKVGIGCLVDSCLDCRYCKSGDQQLCPKMVGAFNRTDKQGKPTTGGYAKDIIVTEGFAIRLPSALTSDPKTYACVAPLLCAGITTYSPLVRHGMNKPGTRIGVLGLGGLGHMAVKFGVAFGGEVTVISRSDHKKEHAIKELGAKHFLNSSATEEMKKAAGTLDCIVNTVSAPINVEQYLELLAPNGVLIFVGIPPHGEQGLVPPQLLLMKQKVVAGSIIGGIPLTQKMVDFCAEKKILPMCEIITAEQVNEAYERTLSSKVQYRFVIDHKRSTFQS